MRTTREGCRTRFLHGVAVMSVVLVCGCGHEGPHDGTDERREQAARLWKGLAGRKQVVEGAIPWAIVKRKPVILSMSYDEWNVYTKVMGRMIRCFDEKVFLGQEAEDVRTRIAHRMRELDRLPSITPSIVHQTADGRFIVVYSTVRYMAGKKSAFAVLGVERDELKWLHLWQLPEGCIFTGEGRVEKGQLVVNLYSVKGTTIVQKLPIVPSSPAWTSASAPEKTSGGG